MKIQLSNGMAAQIDREDHARVKTLKWHFDGRYATANLARGKKIYLHHFILGMVGEGRSTQVDHLNEDKLDCRKRNLTVKSETDHKRQHIKRNKTIYTQASISKRWETRRMKRELKRGG